MIDVDRGLASANRVIIEAGCSYAVSFTVRRRLGGNIGRAGDFERRMAVSHCADLDLSSADVLPSAISMASVAA
jgi:hypothetical protein